MLQSCSQLCGRPDRANRPSHGPVGQGREGYKMKLTDREQIILISQIAARAVRMAKEHGARYAHLDAVMDIEHAHKQHPLDLAELLRADDGNFAHDVFGIRRHMDRTTGKISGCFLPRFARAQS